MIDGLPPRFPIAGQPEATKSRWFIPSDNGTLSDAPSGVDRTLPLLPFSVLEVTGCYLALDGRLTLLVGTPSSANPQSLAVASFDGGLVTMDDPFVALVKTTDRAAGTVLGVASGYKRFESDANGGYVSLGLTPTSPTSLPAWAINSAYGTATLVTRRTIPRSSGVMFLSQGGGVSARSGTTRGSGTVDVISDVAGTLTDTGSDITVVNNSTVAVGATKYGVAVREYPTGSYVVVSAEGWAP